MVAPFAGMIDHVQVERGSWVQDGTPVATILALNPIVVRGEVSERDLADVRIGTSATVNLANGVVVDGRVRHVRSQASEQTRTFQVEVEIPNRGGDDAGRDERRDRAARRPGGRRGGAPVGGDALRTAASSACASSATTDKVVFVPVAVVDDTPGGLVLAGCRRAPGSSSPARISVTDGEAVGPSTRIRSTRPSQRRPRAPRRAGEPLMDIVGTAIRNARLTLSLMLFLTLAGALAYRAIPKEAEPDVQIPIIYVSMSYSGISPEDSERLLLRPMETRLKTSPTSRK